LIYSLRHPYSLEREQLDFFLIICHTTKRNLYPILVSIPQIKPNLTLHYEKVHVNDEPVFEVPIERPQVDPKDVHLNTDFKGASNDIAGSLA
jgi:hypothetical protein